MPPAGPPPQTRPARRRVPHHRRRHRLRNFPVPSVIARSLPSPAAILAVWLFAGILSFFGALAYAELGAMMPATGGQYVFLREAFGPLPAFLSAWTLFLIIMGAQISSLASGFSIYLAHFVPLSPVLSKIAARLA